MLNLEVILKYFLPKSLEIKNQLDNNFQFVKY